jgi:hypothetical protein
VGEDVAGQGALQVAGDDAGQVRVVQVFSAGEDGQEVLAQHAVQQALLGLALSAR